MELRKRCNPKSIFIGLYILAFVIYIIFGLQPAEATNYEISANLSIPSISLSSDVTTLTLDSNGLDTPETIVGSFSNAENKVLLIGHSSSVFRDLNQVKLGEKIEYNGKDYKVIKKETTLKSLISMNKVLASEDRDTLVLMTCAGQMLENSDATHRLMITAIANI